MNSQPFLRRRGDICGQGVLDAEEGIPGVPGTGGSWDRRSSGGEDGARASRALVDSIFASAWGVRIFALDATYRYLAFTSSHSATMGAAWGVEIQVGMDLLEVIADREERARTRRNFDRALKGERFSLVEAYGDDPDHRTWWEHQYAPLRGEGGGITGLTVFAIDVTARQEAERSLKRSHEQLSWAQESAAAGMWEWDVAGGGLTWSPELFRLFGLDPARAEASLSTWRTLIHPEDARVAKDYLLRATSQRGQHHIEGRIVLPGGEVKWLHVQGSTAFDAGGRPLKMSGICLDVTERKRAEARLQENEADFRALFETVTDLILVGTPEGRILYANPAVSRTLGYTPEELSAMHLLDLHARHDRPEAEAIFGAMFRGERANCPLPLARKDGGLVPMDTRVWFGKWTGVPCVFGICKDLSAEQEAQQRFEHLFRSNPNPMALSSVPERVFVDVNEAWLRKLGYQRQEVLGKGSADLGLAADPEQVRRLADELDERGRFTSVELKTRAKDGTLLDGLFSGEVISNQGKQYFLTTMLDITELKRAHEEQAKLQAQLHQSQKMEGLGILASGVAHDMNNVLGAILGLASANLHALPEGSRAQQALRTIIQATERGGKMVNKLLTFARQGPLELQELDLNTLLREEVSLLECTTPAKVRLHLDLAEDLQPMQGEAGALAHAFMNLAINALDAMPEGGSLTFRTRNAGPGWIEALVEDTGTGMSREVMDKALDPFFTTKAEGKGTGLGLPMVFTTVKSHAGDLALDSAPGQGTRVRLRFPALAVEALGLAAAEDPAPEPAARPLAVLVVDDDDLITYTTQMLLEALGHTATLAASGEAALELLQQGLAADAVILDMNMPGLGGIGTLPRIRALRPTLPILLATGRADQTALDLLAGHPAVALLPKPFSLDDLREHLLALLLVP